MPGMTQARLKELLRYDPETGAFTRLVTTSSRAKVGMRAGYISATTGYWYASFSGKHYAQHRLAWLYMTGEWPTDQVDHINGMRSDNRWANLRGATIPENRQNMNAHRDGSSGLLGVSWCTTRKKWVAQLQVNKKPIYIGRFKTKDEAYAAYLAAKAKFHTFNPVPREVQCLA